MTPTALAAQQRHARFHAEIARRAALVPPKPNLTRFIPNTPFGVPKVKPKQPVKWFWPIRECDYWHGMWFYDLVFAQPGPSKPTIGIILDTVCKYYDIKKIDVLSQRRTRTIVRPRQIIMYLAKTVTLKSLPEIGRRLGDRDHTTVLHGVRQIECLMKTNNQIAEDIERIRRELRV